jgi:YbbR domain-containing protein
MWLRYNAITMFISLLLAFIIWIIAYQSEYPSSTEPINNVPVTITGLAENYRITNDPADRVDIELFAQQNTWNALNEAALTAEVDLTGLEPGSWDVPVTVTHPEFSAVTEVDPATISITIERIETRELPIQLDVQGDIAVGFSARPADVTPNTATIEGPASAVQQVSELKVTIPIGSERRETYSQDDLPIVALNAEGEEVTTLTISPSVVSAVVPVQREAGIKEVGVEPVRVNGPPPGYVLVGLTPIPDSIILQGDPDVLEEIPVVYTQLIDLSGLTEDERFTVELSLREGVEALNAENETITTVDVLVAIDPVPGVSELFVPVEVTNLPNGVSASLSVENITVILRGPQRDLNALVGGQNVIVTVDLEGLTEEDTYQVEPTVEIIGFDDVEVISTIPIVITVEIVEE